MISLALVSVLALTVFSSSVSASPPEVVYREKVYLTGSAADSFGDRFPVLPGFFVSF